jgi:hypothetical protein
MNISELLQSPNYRKAFTQALYRLAEDASIGVVLTAAQVHEILSAIEDPTADALVFHSIISTIATENPESKILAVKNSEKGLMVYGYKLGYTEYSDVDGKTGLPCTSYNVGLFGDSLPEGIRLQVSTEKVGSGDKEYLRPVAKLMQDYQSAKGKTLTAVLEVPILDTVKVLKIEYKDWVDKALNLDEDELVEAGLMGQWAEPKLGSGGGDRVNLTQLGEDAMQYGPQTYQVLAVNRVAKEDSRSKYAEVGFDLCIEGGAPIQTWTEVVFGVEKSRDKGGIGFSNMVEDALECGVPYYLHVLGSKPKMRWDKQLNAEVEYTDKQGRAGYVAIDGYLSDQPTINPRLLRAVAAPSVQPALVGAMKSAAVEDNFDDIPF